MDHISFASKLGRMVTLAKFASEYPELEAKLNVWRDVQEIDKLAFLLMGYEESDCISRYTESKDA